MVAPLSAHVDPIKVMSELKIIALAALVSYTLFTLTALPLAFPEMVCPLAPANVRDSISTGPLMVKFAELLKDMP